MMTKTVTIAAMKNRLSEYVSLASAGNARILITRRKRPLAALVPLEDFTRLGQQGPRVRMKDIIGSWKVLGEIAPQIADAYSRRGESHGREVPL